MEGGKGLGGRQRKAGDKRKNVRDAFRNAVDRAIKQIAKYDKPLAEHLNNSIKRGDVVGYHAAIQSKTAGPDCRRRRAELRRARARDRSSLRAPDGSAGQSPRRPDATVEREMDTGLP